MPAHRRHPGFIDLELKRSPSGRNQIVEWIMLRFRWFRELVNLARHLAASFRFSRALRHDPAATRDLVADLLAQSWELLVAPHWPRLREFLDTDVAFRTQTLADYGLERVLADIDVRVEIPEQEQHREETQRQLITESLTALTRLAAG